MRNANRESRPAFAAELPPARGPPRDSGGANGVPARRVEEPVTERLRAKQEVAPQTTFVQLELRVGE